MINKFKYDSGHILDIHEVLKSENKKAISFMRMWIGTPFKMKGCSAYGIDCFNLCKESVKFNNSINHLTDNLGFEVFFDKHPYEPTCSIQYIKKLREFPNHFKFIDSSEVRPFDIIVFPSTSHCGTMLTKKIFIHSLARNKSVIVSNLRFTPWDSVKKIYIRYANNG